MTPYLRSVAAQCYRGARSIRSGQPGRDFSSLHVSGSSLVPRKSVLLTWITAGYVFYFSWEMLAMRKCLQKSAKNLDLLSQEPLGRGGSPSK